MRSVGVKGHWYWLLRSVGVSGGNACEVAYRLREIIRPRLNNIHVSEIRGHI